MKKVLRFSQEWIQQFMTNYYQNLEILIDSYVEFYGEEYRSNIDSILRSIQIQFFLNPDTIFGIKEFDYNDKNACLIKSYLNLVKRVVSRKKINGEDWLYKLVQLTSLKPLKRHEYDYDFLCSFYNESSFAMTDITEDWIKILLPVYLVNNIVIIHEFSHAISSKRLQDENAFLPQEVDEILNQLVSLDVLGIFKKKKGNFVQNDVNFFIAVDDDLFLMQNFYFKFKDLIKSCLIKQDIKILEEALGKNYIDQYFLLVKKLSHKKYILSSDIKKLNFLVMFMEENLKRKGNDYIKKLTK